MAGLDEPRIAASALEAAVTSALKIKGWSVESQPVLGSLQPDLVVSRGSGPRLVIEIKATTQPVHFGTIAQLDSYVRAAQDAGLGADVQGVLLSTAPLSTAARDAARRVGITVLTAPDTPTGIDDLPAMAASWVDELDALGRDAEDTPTIASSGEWSSRPAETGARPESQAIAPQRSSQPSARHHDTRSDNQLLTLAVTTEPDAFAAFYDRHVEVVLAFLRHRTNSPEAAADLLAETFATALLALHTNVEPEQIGVPVAWLLGIARNKLFESYRRGRIEAAARERLGLEPLVLDDSDLALVDELTETDVINRLADLLPPDQLEALRARVIDERDYETIARELQCSEAVIRSRVARALHTLRDQLGQAAVLAANESARGR